MQELHQFLVCVFWVGNDSKGVSIIILDFFSVFTVIYLTSSTAAAAKKQKHKSLSSDNVFSALEEIEFENFIEPLRAALESFRKAAKEKKSNKPVNDSKTNDTSAMNDEDMNESAMEEPTDGTEIEE